MTASTPPGTLLLRTAGTCEFEPEHLIEVFAEQRQRFIEILEGFGPDDWAAPTRCAEWSAHDIVRHLCDVTPAIAASADDRTFDLSAGFDPRVTTNRWLTASEGESPSVTLSRLVARTDEMLSLARHRLAQGHPFDVRLPYGPMDWTVLTLHIFWDSWIHERDVLLARGDEHPTSGDATAYATGYGMFLSAAVASSFGDQVCHRLTLGGDGGGVFDLDGRGTVTLTVIRAKADGRPAAEVADALAGRTPTGDVLGDLPAGTLATLTRLADFFNTPVQQSPA